MVAMGRQQRLMPTSPFTASTAATRLLCPIQVKRSAGVEFTNGDQPGVRFNKAAISNSAKTGRRKAAKAPEKNG